VHQQDKNKRLDNDVDK